MYKALLYLVTLVSIIFLTICLLTVFSDSSPSDDADNKPAALVPDYAKTIPQPSQDNLLGQPGVKVETTYGKGKKDDFHWKQTVYHADGTTPKAVKTLWRNDKWHIHPTGHFVTYDFYRPDGTLERTRMVQPEPNLGASIITSYHIRYFEEDGTSEIRSEYYRPNGKIGVISDRVKNRFTTFRWDGVTVRSVQYTNNDGNTALRYYRKDGRTIWWELTYDKGDDRLEYHFDHDGNPCDKALTRKLLWDDDVEIEIGGHKFTANNIDTYEDENGKRTYRQTWYSTFNPKTRGFRHVLGKVEIFDDEGELVARTIELNLNPFGHHSVTTDSTAGEPTDDEWFKGFNLEPNGYDDESEDI